MNKLFKTLITLVLINAFTANAHATAVAADANAGFYSKVVEKGKVTDTNVIKAGFGVQADSFGFGIDTFNRIESSVGKSAGVLKRVDFTADYKFTSTLADLTLGATYKHASKTAAFNGLANNTDAFIALGGNLFKYAPWSVVSTFDLKNHTNNLEAGVKLPLHVTKHISVAPLFGLGFNDPGATTIAAYKAAKHYYQGGLSLEHNTKYTKVAVVGNIQRNEFTNNNGQVTWYGATCTLKF